MKSRATKASRRRLRENVLAGLISGSITEVLKLLALPAISMLGLNVAVIKRLFPMTSFSDATITALLVTGAIFIPLLIALIIQRPGHAARRSLPKEFAAAFLTGQEIKTRAPRSDANQETIDLWLQELKEWGEEVGDFLTKRCSPHALARFLDISNMTAGTYLGIHTRAQTPLRNLNKALENLSVIMDRPETYSK